MHWCQLIDIGHDTFWQCIFLLKTSVSHSQDAMIPVCWVRLYLYGTELLKYCGHHCLSYLMSWHVWTSEISSNLIMFMLAIPELLKLVSVCMILLPLSACIPSAKTFACTFWWLHQLTIFPGTWLQVGMEDVGVKLKRPAEADDAMVGQEVTPAEVWSEKIMLLGLLCCHLSLGFMYVLAPILSWWDELSNQGLVPALRHTFARPFLCFFLINWWLVWSCYLPLLCNFQIISSVI